MNNYQQPGNVMSCTAPYTRTAGQAALIGSLVGVAVNDVTSGDAGEFAFSGVFSSLAKATGTAWTALQKLYWDDSNKRFSTDSTVGQLAGVAGAAAASGDTTGTVRLNGVAPATAEGAQAAVADLTDNSGGATADGTIGAVTAPAAITDNSGGVDPGNNTIAVVTNPDLSAWNGATDPSAAQATAIGTAFTATKAAIAQLAAKQNVDRTAVIALTDAVKELSTKINTLLAELRIVGVIAP